MSSRHFIENYKWELHGGARRKVRQPQSWSRFHGSLAVLDQSDGLKISKKGVLLCRIMFMDSFRTNNNPINWKYEKYDLRHAKA